MHHGRFASSSVVTADASGISCYFKVVHHQSVLIHGYLIDNASSRYHTPHSQVPIQVPNNPNPLSYGYLAPQSPGQYFYTQPGDIRQMSTGQSAFMNNEMANMTQEIESEFSGENEEQNTFGADMYSDDTFEDDATRSQSLSADFNCLTIEDRHGVFSSRSTLTYGSSSTSVRANKNPKHIIIQGDHTEVDNNFYQSNFDSHKVKNNIIKNSFGEGE